MSSFGYIFSIIVLSGSRIQSSTIPTVDLLESDEKCAETIYDAATKYGFFYLKNHQISSPKLQQLLKHSKDFFNLDTNIKLELTQSNTHFGYVPYLDETVSYTQTQADTKEGYYIKYIHDEHHPNNQTNSFFRENQWPPIKKLPKFRSFIEKYCDEINEVAMKLTRLFAMSLNLSTDFFQQPGIRDDPLDILYLLRYPSEKSNSNNGIFGIGEHSDYDLFTILLTDNNNGLQILNDNKWMDVESKENVFIVNIADTLQQWTNNLYISVKHRVVLDGITDRYSVPYFVGLDYDCKINCLPNTFNNETECDHQPYLYGDYLKWKLQQSHSSLDADTIHQEL